MLVGGFYRGTWKIVRDGERAILRIEPFSRLSKGDAEALAAEGMGLLAFAAADRPTRDVEFTRPG